MARRRYLQVLFQLLWRMRLDLLILVSLCLVAAALPVHSKRELIAHSGMESVLGIAIAVFLAFRNTQAINRWWEARSLWGALLNQSRSWRDTLVAVLGPDRDLRRERRRLLDLQVLSAWLLNFELRNAAQPELRRRVLEQAGELGFAPTVTLQQVCRARVTAIAQLYGQGVLTDLGRDALIRSVEAFNAAVGGLQKIRNSPLPPAYDAFVRLIAWLFGLELYLNCLVADLPLLGGLLFLGFLTAERIGAYVEGPFDRDPSCLSLPLDQICMVISDDLLVADNPFATLPRCNDPLTWT